MSNYVNKAIYTNEFYSITGDCYLGESIDVLDSFQIVVSSEVMDLDPTITTIQEDYLIEDSEITREYTYKTVTEDGATKSYINGLKLTCEIEESIKSLRVGSMGVYAYNSEKGEDTRKLIVIYSSNQTDLKPEGVEYDLAVELSFDMKAQNIEGSKFPGFIITGSDRAKKTEMNQIISNFEDVSDNLEICIDYNTDELDKKSETTQCQRLLDTTANFRDFIGAYKYLQLSKNIDISTCKDMYYLINKTQLHYYVKDILSYFNADNTSSLYMTNNSSTSQGLLFSSSNDLITFNSACTLSMYIKFGDMINNCLLLKKYDSNTSTNYLRVYTLTPTSSSNSNKLVVKIYTNNGYILGEVALTLDNLYELESQYCSLVITFNGNATSPNIRVYLNNTELVLTLSRVGFNSTIPDISGYSLRNYDNEINTNTVMNTGYSISNIMFFNSILSSSDISFLSLLNTKTIF